MNLTYLKYIGDIALLVELVEKLKTLVAKDKIDGEPLEWRPSYKGKKFSITIIRTK